MTTALETVRAEIAAMAANYFVCDTEVGTPISAALEAALTELEEDQLGIRRLRLEPGDILVMLDPSRLRDQDAERFRDFIRKALTECGVPEVPVIVLDGGRSLQLLKASASLLQPREPLAFSKPDDSGDLFPKAETEARDVTRIAAVDLTGQELTAEIERVEGERKAFGADAGDHARMVELNALRAEQDRRWQEANRLEDQS